MTNDSREREHMFEPTHVLKDLDGQRLVEMGTDTEQSLLWDEEAFVRDEVGTKIICLKRQLTPATAEEDVTDFAPEPSLLVAPSAVAGRIARTDPRGLTASELGRVQVNAASLAGAYLAGAVDRADPVNDDPTYHPRPVTLDDYVQDKPNRPALAGGGIGKLRPKTLAALEVAYILANGECETLIRRRDAMTQAQCRALIRHGYVQVASRDAAGGAKTITVTLAGKHAVWRIRDSRE